MKRVILLTGTMILLAANAFATDVSITFANTFSGFSRSKSVIVAYASGNSTGASCAGTPTTCVHFAASAKNSSGDRTYSAIDTQSAVYMSTGVLAGEDLATGDNPSVPDAGGAAITGGIGGWTSM